MYTPLYAPQTGKNTQTGKKSFSAILLAGGEQRWVPRKLEASTALVVCFPVRKNPNLSFEIWMPSPRQVHPPMSAPIPIFLWSQIPLSFSLEELHTCVVHSFLVKHNINSCKMSFCFGCRKNGEVQKCSGCRQAFYCSKACQRKHWKKHKPNCGILSMSSLHNLVDACRMNSSPIPSVRCDYGFDNMCLFHSDVPSAEIILLGVYQMIVREIYNQELDNTDCVLSSIGVSKRVILDAYEANALDQVIQRFIRNVIDRHGDRSPRCCFEWLQNKLIVGPTRLLLSEEVALTLRQQVDMRSEIYRNYYG